PTAARSDWRRSRGACPGARREGTNEARPGRPPRRARACANRPRPDCAYRRPRPNRTVRISLPYPPCRLHDALELAPLVFLAHEIADHVGSEAALRADGEPLERDVFGGLVHAPRQVVDSLQLGDFRADQPEHYHLVLGHETERREAAGARAVVLEEEALVRQLVEEPLGDCVVAALAVPHAALVAAAEMDAEGDAREPLHEPRVRSERAREICHRVLAALLHRL